MLAAATGQHARVPLLLGAAQAIRESLGSRGYGYYRPDPATIEAAATDARDHLGSDRYDDALDTGRGLSPTDAAAMLPRPRRLTQPVTRTPLVHLRLSVVRAPARLRGWSHGTHPCRQPPLTQEPP